MKDDNYQDKEARSKAPEGEGATHFISAVHRQAHASPSGQQAGFALLALALQLLGKRHDGRLTLPEACAPLQLLKPQVRKGLSFKQGLLEQYRTFSAANSQLLDPESVARLFANFEMGGEGEPQDSYAAILEALARLQDVLNPRRAGQLFREVAHRLHFLERDQPLYFSSAPAVTDVVMAVAGTSQSVYEPTMGIATWLIEIAKQSYHPSGIGYFGQEIDATTFAFARLHLLVSGLYDAEVSQSHALLQPPRQEGRQRHFELVLADIPWGHRNWGFGDEALERRLPYGTPPRSRGDWAFVGHMFTSATSPRGRVVCTLPPSALFRSGEEARIRAGYVRDGFVEAVILLPRGLSASHGTATAILTLSRSDTRPNVDRILFIDASELVEGKRAATRLTEGTVERIAAKVAAFRQGQSPSTLDEGRFATSVAVTQVADNDYSLQLSRYVDMAPALEPIDYKATLNEYREVLSDTEQLYGRVVHLLQHLNP